MVFEVFFMQITEIARAFAISGAPTGWKAFGQGHINQTYKVNTDDGNAYILQRINQYVFRQPELLMENAFAISHFLKERQLHLAPDFLPTRDGHLCYRDQEGEYWRMYRFVPGKTLEQVESPQDFYRCGLGFGKFQTLLAQFPAHTLHEIIPNFHNTVARFQQLHDSICADPAGRVTEVSEEIGYLSSMEQRAGSLQRMLESGELPLRVTHNDTKLSNILFDEEYNPCCILDLDTVMPGIGLLDFADGIRSGAATAKEDEADISKMQLNLQLFQAFATGFMEASLQLTPAEVNMLAESALIITLEQAARFLKDYLDGDVYYHTAYPGHNPIRTRAQIALAKDMTDKMEQMSQIILEIQEKMNR